MIQNKWIGALFVVAIASTNVAFAIEGGAGDRDVTRGPDRDDSRMYDQQQSRGMYYQDDEMRARHQRARDDDAERRYSRDFDVQGKMNN